MEVNITGNKTPTEKVQKTYALYSTHYMYLCIVEVKALENLKY